MDKKICDIVTSFKGFLILSAFCVMLVQVYCLSLPAVDLNKKDAINEMLCEQFVEPPREVGKDFLI